MCMYYKTKVQWQICLTQFFNLINKRTFIRGICDLIICMKLKKKDVM